MIRAIALTVALLFGIGVLIPLATESTEAGQRKARKNARKNKKVKKYSRRWWRSYRARQYRGRKLRSRKRALRVRQIRLERQKETAVGAGSEKSYQQLVRQDVAPALLPSGEAAPKTWKKSQSTPAELQFRVDDENGSALGSASISVVGPAAGESNTAGKHKTIGGVPTASLRRGVIDRMISENGWVVNDYVKEVGGQKVYVVVAQSEEKGGAVRQRMFYFTEVEGRIYSVSTSASKDASQRIAEESEKVISSLSRRRKNVQQAGLK